MYFTRRQLVVGGAILGSGAGLITATGAFDSVDADREITVEFADDVDAILGMGAVPDDDRDYVRVETGTDGTIAIKIDRINRNARTIVDRLVAFTNNGTRTVEELAVSLIDDESQNASLKIHDDLAGVSIDPGETVVGLGFTINTLTTDGHIGSPAIDARIQISTVTG